jgi:transposase-like protein
MSEAHLHWRTFLESLIERGLSSVQLIISDDHSGLRKTRQAKITSGTF